MKSTRMMQGSRSVAWTVGIAVSALGAGAVCAQIYPAKPVRIVTTEAAGGTPADLAQAIRLDIATTGNLIRVVGIRAE